jgi:hypothetical protein
MKPRFRLVLIALLLCAGPAAAHESRPAYLEIRELPSLQYEALWKRPALGERVLGIAVRWPESCSDAAVPAVHIVPGARIEHRFLKCGDGLAHQRIVIDGLHTTLTDVLVRIEFGDGTVQTNLVKPAASWVDVDGPRPASAIAGDYAVLGVEHILLGIDHLLFVLGLVLIVRGAALLVKTITAFTIAHSVTLGLATLGWVAVPPVPVEAVIALSILFLAHELVRRNADQAGLTTRFPWLVAFAFGLLHGFGFAGALAEVGLPQGDIPLALLSFNIGVEAGQLLFVAAVLSLLWFAARLFDSVPAWLRPAPAYGIGSLAAFWFIERAASLV